MLQKQPIPAIYPTLEGRASGHDNEPKPKKLGAGPRMCQAWDCPTGTNVSSIGENRVYKQRMEDTTIAGGCVSADGVRRTKTVVVTAAIVIQVNGTGWTSSKEGQGRGEGQDDPKTDRQATTPGQRNVDPGVRVAETRR
ncbi:hypothetical protein GGX14DRAFT_401964 [Mycena pura]|uniref:Uncharacterized protein n=1 Tax=Mycena pura TaxID=153505 RepID=A0AAD6Y5U3_9AGAR|nr:hypothetical protein GGX14DRAFT_401964 [Mycena pura]